MRKTSLRILLASLLFIPASISAQHEEAWKDSFKERLESIKTFPLETLPGSDCRLSDLESEIYLSYLQLNHRIPTDLSLLAEQKRREIDFMRSHIDSLYYIQALQAINQQVPDWQLAQKNIEKALLHNRFFIKAVIFKMNLLSLEKGDAKNLLQYLNLILSECPHPQKIRQMAQTVYGNMLKEAEDLISHKLYRDALELCGLIETYCLPEFPIRYLPYKEKLLRNMAHQGIYRSYHEVAEKAFSQRQYQLAQKYALQAFDYFKTFENHMDGLNRVLGLLDRIATEYSRIASVSDMEEQAFYSALIDSIVNHTGLVLVPGTEYNLNEDLALELEMLNRSLHPDTVPAAKESPASARTTESSRPSPTALSVKPSSEPARLSPQQARKQFELDCEQARYLNSRRKFPEAYAWLEDAMLLKRKYGIKVNADFDTESLKTLSQAVEQLVNKAVFQLWSNNETRADSLYSQATALFESYRDEYPEAIAELTTPQQILDSYLQKRTENHCRKWSGEMERTKVAFYRQASFGNYDSAKQKLQQIDHLLTLRRQAELTGCPDSREETESLRKIFTDWTSCRKQIGEAFDLLKNGDTIAFIEKYRKTERLFKDLGLEKHTPAEPSLFSRLSACGDSRTLLIWADHCIRQKDWEQARFITAYLLQKDYRRKYVEKLAKQIKKAHE